jgi:hypothetical protein
MKIRYLLDEHLSPSLVSALLKLDAEIDVLRIGNIDAPPLGTLDPEILLVCEAEQRLLVTRNRRSMSIHLREHYEAGHRHWGVFYVSRRISLGDLAYELYVYWAASEAEEWVDHVEWIP